MLEIVGDTKVELRGSAQDLASRRNRDFFMRLTAFAASNFPAIEMPDLASDRELTSDIQGRLSALGLVDPPIDGKLGPVTIWGMFQFARKMGLPIPKDEAGLFSTDMAQRLISDDADLAFPSDTAGSDQLTSSVLRAMSRRGYWVCRHPDCVNIIYIEGLNENGKPNKNEPNKFNDLRLLLSFDSKGKPSVVARYQATTEPGKFWTEHPMSPDGAARIAFGQYKSWSVGTHHYGSRGAHEALVQVAPVTVFRDKNRDFKRDGDRRFTGLFGINQHWGYDMPENDLGRSSAGCLVGRTKDGHREFMKLVKADARYKNSKAYRFVAAIMPASALTEASFDPTSPH